jgi:uncharacterized damage-inducible protein DinB
VELSFQLDCASLDQGSNYPLQKTLLLAIEELNLSLMTVLSVFRTLARYNRIANQRLYAACAQIADEDYRRQRAGSFGSIHALLNHNLLADRIWMSRFTGGGKTTPPLNTVLYDQFHELQIAREQEDGRMEEFFQNAPANFLTDTLSYTNSKGQAYEEAAVPAVLHMFNHQTHHRGQIHVMLSQCGVQPPSLDMHRILNP